MIKAGLALQLRTVVAHTPAVSSKSPGMVSGD